MARAMAPASAPRFGFASTGVPERALERRGPAEHCGVEGKVAVGRVRGDRQIRVADVEKDGLGPGFPASFHARS